MYHLPDVPVYDPASLPSASLPPHCTYRCVPECAVYLVLWLPLCPCLITFTVLLNYVAKKIDMLTWYFGLPICSSSGCTPDILAIHVCSRTLLVYLVSLLEYLLNDNGSQQQHHFHVNRSSGVLTVAKPLDFEETSLYSLDVVAKDCGSYPLSQHTTVVILIGDVNDNAPLIRLHPQLGSSSVSDLARPDNEIEVSEQAKPGTFIAHLSVHDRDSTDNGRFSCFLAGFDVGGLFSLRRFHHGEYALTVSGWRRLDHKRYEITVTCADHGQPSAVSTHAVSVVVIDKNDNDPQFSVNPVVTSLVENNPIGAVIAVVSAFDKDRGVNGRVTYSLQPSAVTHWLDVDRVTGTIAAKVSFDREQTSTIEFDVVAVDGGRTPRTARTRVNVTIEDEDDEVTIWILSSIRHGLLLIQILSRLNNQSINQLDIHMATRCNPMPPPHAPRPMHAISVSRLWDNVHQILREM